ncbi:MAG TPA: GntR family transcriptional regulator [Erysipelothrix sp.]|nr:GntR family transcriptional regulator [Erysipelothrix sp.]
MININPNTNIPIFEQIVNEIGKYISLGIYKPDDKLPSVRGLAKDLGINPNTVARAYETSEQLGLTYSMPGKGHFISKKETSINNLIQPIYKELTHLIKQLKTLGETNEDILSYIEREIL